MIVPFRQWAWLLQTNNLKWTRGFSYRHVEFLLQECPSKRIWFANCGKIITPNKGDRSLLFDMEEQKLLACIDRFTSVIDRLFDFWTAIKVWLRIEQAEIPFCYSSNKGFYVIGWVAHSEEAAILASILYQVAHHQAFNLFEIRNVKQYLSGKDERLSANYRRSMSPRYLVGMAHPTNGFNHHWYY